jgi:hypothetical protein
MVERARPYPDYDADHPCNNDMARPDAGRNLT